MASRAYTCVDEGAIPGMPGRYRLYVHETRRPISVLYDGATAVLTDFELHRPAQYELPHPATPAVCDELVSEYLAQVGQNRGAAGT